MGTKHKKAKLVTNKNDQNTLIDVEQTTLINFITSMQENTKLISVGDKKIDDLIGTGAFISCAVLQFLKKTNLQVSTLISADKAYIAGVGHDSMQFWENKKFLF